jgi:putative molybdopterin biosynthesis protein
MIEKVRQLDSETVEIFESVAPWNHVRLMGEDVVATELFCRGLIVFVPMIWGRCWRQAIPRCP